MGQTNDDVQWLNTPVAIMPEVVIGNFGSTDFPMAADGIAAGQNVSSPAASWTPPSPPPPQAYYPPPPVHEYYPPPSPPPVYYPPPSWEHPPTAPLKEQPPSTYEYRPPQSPGYYEPPMRVYSPPVHHAQAPNPPAEFRQLEDLSQELLSSSQFMSLWGAPSFLPTVSYPQNHYQADTTPNHVFLSGTGAVQDRPDSVGVFGGVHPDYWDKLRKEDQAAEAARAQRQMEEERKRNEAEARQKIADEAECWEVSGNASHGFSCTKKRCAEVRVAPPHVGPPPPGSVIRDGRIVDNQAAAKEWIEACEKALRGFSGNQPIETPQHAKDEAKYYQLFNLYERSLREWEKKKEQSLLDPKEDRDTALRDASSDLADETKFATRRYTECLKGSLGIGVFACQGILSVDLEQARRNHEKAVARANRDYEKAEGRWLRDNPPPSPPSPPANLP